MLSSRRTRRRTYEHKPASFQRPSPRRKGVHRLLTSIENKIGDHQIVVEYGERRIKAVEGRNDEKGNKEREKAQSQLNEAKEARNALEAFKNDVEKNWATTDSRILGHVVYSLPSSSVPAPQTSSIQKIMLSSRSMTTRSTGPSFVTT